MPPSRTPEAFCDERKKMCEAQVVSDCEEKHQKALAAAKNECESADTQSFETCVATNLSEKEKAEKAKCTTEKTASCPKDCLAACDVPALSTCLGNLQSDHDEAEMFCNDFWRMLRDSSEVDPATGDPVVLLAEG